MTPTGPPRARPGASVVAVVSGALLIVLAVVAVRDLAVDRGWASGSAWVPDAVASLDGLSASTAVVVLGVVLALVGLLLVVAALKPAPVTHVAARADADVWLSPRAVAELAREAADRTAGVASARVSSSSTRRVVVEVTAAAGAGSDVGRRVEQALDEGVRRLTATRVVLRQREVAR